MGTAARRQPQGLARVNRTNGLARGLQYAYAPSSLMPLASGVVTSAAALDVNTVRSGGGSIVLPQISVGTEGTILLHAQLIGNSTFQYFYDGATGVARDLLYSYNDNLSCGWYINGQLIQDAPGSLSGLITSVPAPVILRWTANSQQAFRGNKLIASVTVALSGGSSRSIKLLSKNTNAEMLTSGGISGFAQWNRALSDTEVSALATNPWQIFDASNQPIYAVAAASTATGTSAGTSTASATSQSLASGTATAAGTSTATAVGSTASTSSATGTAAGTSTASAAGTSTRTSQATAAGASTASATGASTSAGSAVATAAGTSTAAATGSALAQGAGTAAGTSAAAAVSPSVSNAVGTATGSSTAIAYLFAAVPASAAPQEYFLTLINGTSPYFRSALNGKDVNFRAPLLDTNIYTG